MLKQIIRVLQAWGVYVGYEWSNNFLLPKVGCPSNRFNGHCYRYRLHFMPSKISFETTERLVIKPLYSPRGEKYTFFEEVTNYLNWYAKAAGGWHEVS